MIPMYFFGIDCHHPLNNKTMDERDYIALNKSILDDEISDEMKDRIELRKELTQFKAENERLKAEVKQLRDFINNSCTYKPSH
jgi:peptidoglycan hydrolase CwlO-like protein